MRWLFHRASLKGLTTDLRATTAASPSCHNSPINETFTSLRSMENLAMRFLHRLTLLAPLFLSACGYNQLQSEDEAVKASWSEVLNQYQRRADLVPNLVNTVKGYADHEKEVLTQVTEARAKVGKIEANADLLSKPQIFKQFQAAQGDLSSALSKLMVVSENYPQLKADTLFRDLQAQLEGTENRITVARNRYIETIKVYNILVRSFPSNLTAKLFGLEIRPNFAVENEAAISTPPTVDFGHPSPAH